MNFATGAVILELHVSMAQMSSPKLAASKASYSSVSDGEIEFEDGEIEFEMGVSMKADCSHGEIH